MAVGALAVGALSVGGVAAAAAPDSALRPLRNAVTSAVGSVASSAIGTAVTDAIDAAVPGQQSLGARARAQAPTDLDPGAAAAELPGGQAPTTVPADPFETLTPPAPAAPTVRPGDPAQSSPAQPGVPAQSGSPGQTDVVVPPVASPTPEPLDREPGLATRSPSVDPKPGAGLTPAPTAAESEAARAVTALLDDLEQALVQRRLDVANRMVERASAKLESVAAIDAAPLRFRLRVLQAQYDELTQAPPPSSPPPSSPPPTPSPAPTAVTTPSPTATAEPPGAPASSGPSSPRASASEAAGRSPVASLLPDSLSGARVPLVPLAPPTTAPSTPSSASTLSGSGPDAFAPSRPGDLLTAHRNGLRSATAFRTRYVRPVVLRASRDSNRLRSALSPPSSP